VAVCDQSVGDLLDPARADFGSRLRTPKVQLFVPAKRSGAGRSEGPGPPGQGDATFSVWQATLDAMAGVPNRVNDPTLAELLRRLVPAYLPERVYLFGSRARGEAGPDSDYDLLLVVSDDAPPERRRSRLAYEVLRGTGVAADVLVWTRQAFEARLGVVTSLPATVLREGQVLLGA